MPQSTIKSDIEVELPSTLPRPPATWKKRSQYWFRWLHVYTSMISLLIVLFFGITGVTLNHPSWTFGDDLVRTTHEGTLPPEFNDGGSVEFLTVSEFLRTEHGVKGNVDDFDADGSIGTIFYAGPGYKADVSFDTSSGVYELTIDQYGFVAIMNDLHKGRDTNSSWGWVIDVSAGFLVVVAATGLGIQLFFRKRRRLALSLVVIGSAVSLLLMWITLV